MLTTFVASRSIFDHAIAASRAIGPEIGTQGLHSDLDATLDGLLCEAWDSVEHALKGAFVYGRDHVKDLIEVSRTRIEQLLEQAGNRARELHSLLLERMREFMHTFLNDALTLMPDSLLVGTRFLTVE
jgi:hypothetical protein